MSKKWIVVHEYDLKQGAVFHGEEGCWQGGEVALFDSKKEADDWVAAGEDIEGDPWDINYLRIEV